MRIGISVDDTICNTTKIVRDRLSQYSESLGLDPLDIMNDEELKANFFSIYYEDIYRNVEIKRNVAAVIHRLRSKGNEIYLITSRTINVPTSAENIFEITEKWLKENDVEADAIITSVSGESKASVCKKYNIDIMIDDDPYSYHKIKGIGKKCLLYDDREEFALRDDYVTNWFEVEKYIERNRI